ncbi:MAG TPA: hypothetical protein VMF89_15970, partial [Polyangiales bacterium]|nr:hypothetical protein [Polyangiales bacterium]
MLTIQKTAKLGMTGVFLCALAACGADPGTNDDESVAPEVEEGIPGGDSHQPGDKAVNRMYIEWCRSPA